MADIQKPSFELGIHYYCCTLELPEGPSLCALWTSKTEVKETEEAAQIHKSCGKDY